MLPSDDVLKRIAELKAQGYSATCVKAQLWLEFKIPEDRLGDWLRLYRKVNHARVHAQSKAN